MTTFRVGTSTSSTEPWWGNIAGCFGDGNPATLMRLVQMGNQTNTTPTNVSTSVARCCLFVLPAAMVVNKVRYYGAGNTSDIFRLAIYRFSDLARLCAETAFSTTANTWGAAGSSLNVSLSANTPYFIAISVNTTGSSAGAITLGTSISAAGGQIQTAPASLPGNMAAATNGYMQSYLFQFAVTNGVLPDPAATLANQANWTGGFPALWLDNSNA